MTGDMPQEQLVERKVDNALFGGQQATALEFLHMNDPRNYKFLPPEFTQGIKAAGKLTANSKANVRSLLSHDG